MKNGVINFIDFFYPLAKRIMPLQTFRYAVCGGVNTLLGLLIYFVFYHFVFQKILVDVGFFVFKPHMAALFVAGFFSFIIGFILNKYIVFTISSLRGRIQLFRYLLSFIFNLALNYCMLKLMVEIFAWDAFFSQLLTTAFIVAISYLSQKHFSFKSK
jgi:putative flippase GtrA